jgi:hypothetical protein
MDVKKDVLLLAKSRKQDVKEFYHIKGNEQEVEDQLEKVWYTIGTDKVWAYEMEVYMLVTVFKYPLKFVSDVEKNFDVLDNRDDNIRKFLYLSNIHENHFNVLFPLASTPFYPSFPPFPHLQKESPISTNGMVLFFYLPLFLFFCCEREYFCLGIAMGYSPS